MNIISIYQRFDIPPNLERHMLEVACVGRFVCDHWVGNAVDTELITRVLLLHDMGNIVKFKRPFLGELKENSQYWENVQDIYRQRYGDNAYVATEMIVAQLHVDDDVVKILETMQDGSLHNFVQSSSEIQICQYSDCCVSPEGIVGFDERLKDLRHRYQRFEKEDWTEAIRANAQVVEKKMNVKASALLEVSFSAELEILRNYDIEEQ